MALDPDLARQSTCQLETVGRVSGKSRVIEIWFAADADRDRIYLLSGGRDRAQWVRNIRQNGAVRIRIGASTFRGEAAEIEGGPDDDLARRLLLMKYQGGESGSLSGWARDSLPLAVDLDPLHE